MTSAAVVRRRVRRLVPRPALAVAAVASVAVALIPLTYLGVRVGNAGWARISEELFRARTGELAARSLALAGVVTTACTALGVASAFLVTRTDLSARRLFGVDTLATELWSRTSVSAYAAAAPYAALLAAVPTWWLSAHTGVLTQAVQGGGS
jgi:iron(III) transport system permease protein